MNVRLHILILLEAACLSPASVLAQLGAGLPSGNAQNPLTPGLADSNQYNFQQWVVVGKVMTLRGDPVAGAKVEVAPTSVSGGFPTPVTNLQGEFQTRYGRDVKKMPFEVCQFWGQIEDRRVDYIHHPLADLDGLVPATDQGQLDSILSAVGKTVAEFFSNFPNTSSLEEIHEEKSRGKQEVGATLDQKFRYLCFTPAGAWGPGFDEYRVDLSGRRAWPQGLQDGFMLTSGFASASLVFHPMYQSQADFRYLGRQPVNGRDAYVIAFAQQPAKARLRGTFKSGQRMMATFSQGLAWIDSQSYQITRIRTDLLKPLPEIKLERQTTVIAFCEVHFKAVATGFWLPQRVIVVVDWNGKYFRNEHRYSEFKVFNVETIERRGKRKESTQTSE
jgi:hypothetical protein